MLTDTHCHIHEADFPIPAEEVFAHAKDAGVTRMICVGTDEMTSQEAVAFSAKYDNIWASVGLHPHDAKHGVSAIDELKALIVAKKGKIVAIGECGLDYFYDNSPRVRQIEMFEAQLQVALDYNLPVIFHVREAFDDFWPIFHNFPGLRGVLHSFTDNQINLEKGLSEGLYVGVNGISTFTKDTNQQAVFDMIPMGKMLLETDAPFLTPSPHRGKVNEPAFVRHVAEYHAKRRDATLEHLARATSANATELFAL